MASINFRLEGREVTLTADSKSDLKFVLTAVCVAYWDASHHNEEHGYPGIADHNRDQAHILHELTDGMEEDDEEEDDIEDILDGDLEDVLDRLLGGEI